MVTALPIAAAGAQVLYEDLSRARGDMENHIKEQQLMLFAPTAEVRVDWHKKDRYGRLIGSVWVASPDAPCRRTPDCAKTLDVGMAQLTVGLAWHYKRYAHEQDPQQRGQYEFAEKEARAKRAGLWSDLNPVSPWEWRGTRG